MLYAICISNGKCSKIIRKSLIRKQIKIRMVNLDIKTDNRVRVIVGKLIVNNRWVVPHKFYLSTKFDCHINVERVQP